MKRLCLLTTSILLTFSLFVTGCSNDDGNSPQTVTPTSTSGSIAAATTNASGQKTASLSTSTGTYAFTETSAQAASLLRAATVDETKSGAWTFTEKDKTSAKYSGTYKGDISQLAKAEVKLSLTVTQTANSEGQLVNAESVSFDLTATTSKFTAAIPEVKEASEAKTEDKTDETTEDPVAPTPAEETPTDEPTPTDNPAEEPATEPTTDPETEQTANFDASNAASYELGTIVKYTDDDTENEYEVIKNTFFTEESTARAARASVKEEWESTDRYQNDEVMFAKVEQFTQFREYLVLYLLTTYSVNDKNDIGKLEDTYIFLDKDGKKILQWKWQWASNYVISQAKLGELRGSNPGKTDAEIKLEIWNNLSVSKLREKDPERLILRDYPADGNQTFYYDCAYNRYGDLKASEGSETIDYNDDSLIQKIQHYYYTQLPNGKVLNYYSKIDKPNNANTEWEYAIKCDGGQFFNMSHRLKNDGSHKAWQFEARGDGAFYGRNAQSVGEYVLSIESLGANKPKVSVNTKGTFNKETGLIPSDESVKITVPGGFHFHLSWLESKDDEKSSEDTSSTNSSSNSSQSSSGDDNNAGDSSNTSASNDSSSEGGYVEQGTKEIHVPKYITVKLSSVLDTNNDNKHYEGELEPYAQINFINPVYDEETNDIIWTTPDIESVISTWLPAYKNFRINGTN